MGLYHYAMFVHTAFCQNARADFATYHFAEAHIACERVVQKLRVDESYCVPRLNGLNLPVAHISDTNRETHAMMKTLLFRDIHFPSGVYAYEEQCALEVVADLVDERGSFVSGWEAWYGHQRVLSDQFLLLQEAAGKLFALDDIDVDLSDVGVDGRERPSPSEYMARITVETVTHMDMAAEAKGRPSQQTRRDVNDYEGDEIDAGKQCASASLRPEDGPPAGPSSGAPDVLIPSEAMSKIVDPLFNVSQEDVPRVAFFDEVPPSNMMN